MFSRQWTDKEKWVMGVVSSLLVAGVLSLRLYDFGSVSLHIAKDVDSYGRCVDRELLLLNETNMDAADITIGFDVDYFTRRGDLQISYGDEIEQLITSAISTIIDRKEYVPIAHELNVNESKIIIPKLKPGEYIHLYYGGDTIKNSDAARKRRNLLDEGVGGLMNKPAVNSASMKDGKIERKVVSSC